MIRRLGPLPFRAFVPGLLSAALLAACAGPDVVPESKAQLTLQGDLTGALHAGPPSACGAGETLVVGVVGEPGGPSVDLRVDSDSSVVVDAGPLGLFSGEGVTFRAGSGWDLDAHLKSRAGRRITIRGHLPC